MSEGVMSLGSTFEVALRTFVEGCEQIRKKWYEEKHPTLFFGEKVSLHTQKNKRWIKITCGTSIYCFIDPTNGDVLKPESWSRPAKHARGNLFDASGGLERMGPHGPAYLR